MRRTTRFCLALSVFAVALTARVSAVTSFPIANSSGDENTFGAASDGTNYLVSVQHNGPGAQLISSTGALIGGQIVPPGHSGDPSRIAFDGANYLLAWSRRISMSALTPIYGQRVTRQGALLGSPFLISQSTTARDFDGMAFDGTNHLLVWTDSRRPPGPGDKDIYGRFVSTAGVPLGNEFKISGAAGRGASIAFAAPNYLVVWSEDVADAEVRGQFVSPAGAMIGSEFTVNASPALTQFQTGVAFDGVNFLVLWDDLVGGVNEVDLFAHRVSPAGAAVGGLITVVAAPGTQIFPGAVFDGTSYLLGWTDLSNDLDHDLQCDSGEGTCLDAFARFITPSGAPVGSTFAVSADPLSQVMKGLVYGGGKFLAVLDELGIDDVSEDVIGRFMDASSTTTISINDVSLNEGNSGQTSATFAVNLNAPNAGTVTVQYETSDLTANAGSDYTATGPLTLTFDPGMTTRTLSVPVLGDGAVESAETFQVALSAPFNATITDGVGVGMILNDDVPPPSRVFVSPTGNDSGDCANQATPCRNIAAALTQVAADGEIIILTAGEYESSPLTINKSVKVTSPSGTVAFVRQPITINAPGARVALRGLTLEGSGAGNGVTLIAANSVSIEASTVGGRATGLAIANLAAAQVTITNSVFRANGAGVDDTGGASANRVSIEDSRFERNSTGLKVVSGAFMVRESAFLGHTVNGIVAGPGSASIQRSEFSNNFTAVATVTGGSITIGRSRVFGNGTGLSSTGGGTLSSLGTNVVLRNTINTAGTITLVPEQ